MRPKDFTAAAVDRRLLGAHTSLACSLLGPHLLVGAVDFVAGLGGGGALAGVGGLVGDGLVEEVAAEGEVEVGCRVGLEVEGLEGREGVDRYGDGRGWGGC